MLDLVPRLQQHFDSTQDRFRCFSTFEFQCEGWFEGELLTILYQLQKQHLVQEIDREVKVGSKKIDVKIRDHDELHWIELKHWLIGSQRSFSYGPSFYFADPTSVGIVKDVDKLSALNLPGRRWLFLLLTTNPGTQAWAAGVEKFNSKFAPRHLISKTRPDHFSQAYFLGLLEVGEL